MTSKLFTFALLAAAALPAAASAQADEEPTAFVVDALHVGDGTVLENAVVTLVDGKIAGVVAGGAAPDGAIHVEGAHLTPGLVDAFSYMAVDDQTVEQSRETTASLKLADSLRLDHPSFRRAAGEGVTTAFLTPDTLNAFGGLAAIVKTAGGQPADLFAPEHSAARIIDDAAALKISLGNDVAMGNRTPNRLPNSFMIRRPTTRMGTVWTIRSTFYDAQRYAEAQADSADVSNPDFDVVLQALNGEIPLRIHARRNNDLQTALRLSQEFGWRQFVVEEGTEAYRCAELLAEAGVPVVAGPAYDTRQRAVASGPLLAEMRALATPMQICCEGLHDDSFVVEPGSFDAFPHRPGCEADAPAGAYKEVARDEWGIPIDPHDPLHDDHDHAPTPAGLPEAGLAQDLMLALGGEEMARGLRSGRFSEGDQSTPALASLLVDAGVSVALGGAEAHDETATESSLIHQARRAVDYGLARERAIALVTSEAAALCGLGDRVGQVAAGYDADLVLWSGDPLAHSSRPLVVVVDGKLVVDARN